jgi:PHD/YefM family antitoxin component YafN of YafNO toxin-antitoxin module
LIATTDLRNEVTVVLNINATSFRKDMFRILEQTIKWGEPVNISTKDGNAVIISEDDYNGLMETLYLSSMPDVKSAIIEGLNTPVSECIPENEVQW